MKRSSLIAMLGLAFGVSSAHAQIHYGVKAGLNIAAVEFNANYEADFGSVIGFYAGAYLNINLADRLNLQPELLLSGQGYKYDHPQFDEDPQFRNTYLNLPIMFRYRVIEQLYLEGGPQIGFLISSRAKLGDDTENSIDTFKSTDVGLNVGLGYHLPAGFAAALRYNFGLSSISTDLQEGVESINNRVFSFGIAYTIK